MNNAHADELYDGYWSAAFENSSQNRSATPEEVMALLADLGLPDDDFEVEDLESGLYNIRLNHQMVAKLVEDGEMHENTLLNGDIIELHVDSGDFAGEA